MVSTTSFTAASNYPLKVLLNKTIIDKIIDEKFIVPWHIQINPTAICEQNCDWCSCINRNKKTELSLEEIISVFKTAKKLGGGGATTITGDGNPTLHPNINEIIVALKKLDVDVAIVHNGWSINKLDQEALDCLTWMRISFGDGQLYKTSKYWSDLSKVVSNNKVSFSFSYVLTANPDLALIQQMIEFANLHGFSHVRIVNNIFDAKDLAETMVKTCKAIRGVVDDHLVIWQGRDQWVRGVERCYCSLLRPVLGSDGFWYSCCGNQYMLAKPTRCYTLPMSGLRCSDGLLDIVKNQRWFNGKICEKCYYDSYNQLLEILLSGIEHTRFV